MSADNKAVNRRFYAEAINQKNLAVIDEICATDFVSHAFPPGIPPNREGLKMFLGLFHTAFADGHASVEQQVAEGDRVVSRVTFTGTHTGNFQGLPPTGKKIALQAIDIWRYAGGQAAESWGGPDQLSLLMQLGVVPPPGG